MPLTQDHPIWFPEGSNGKIKLTITNPPYNYEISKDYEHDSSRHTPAQTNNGAVDVTSAI
jgi:hypothetical protein